MFFKKKKQEKQIKPGSDGILSYRDLKHDQNKKNEPTKIDVMLKKIELKLQNRKVSIKNILEKIKNTLACHSERISQQTEKLKNPVLNITSRITKGSFISFRMTKQAVKIFLKDHVQLLIKSSAENHLRIQKCKKIKDGDICNLEFDSYSQLKKYQKKVRILTFSTSSTLSLILITSILLQLLMPALPTRGATFYFDQTSWEASANPTAKGVHPGDQSSFSDYESKDEFIAIQNPDPQDSAITLATVSSNETKIQTSGTDFATGTNNGTGVGGSGDGAFVFPCEFDHGGNVWEPTNGDTWDLDSSGAISIAGTHCNISNFTIASGKTVFVKAYDGTNYGVVRIYATNSTIIGSLDASGKGYRGVNLVNGEGPGGGGVGGHGSYGFAGAGGGFGGEGGYGTSGFGGPSAIIGSAGYGSIANPIDFGSAGGSTISAGNIGGNGGGAIKLDIKEAININGSVLSTGGAGVFYGGAGAGGSVWISSGTISGSGIINANGASASSRGGAGGGGRISINFDTKNFTGSILARGATSGYLSSGAGTIYQKSTSQLYGDLLIDNNNQNGTYTPLFTTPQSVQYESLAITKYAKVTNAIDVVTVDLNVTANGAITNTGNTVATNLNVDTGGVLNTTGNVTVSNSINGFSSGAVTLASGTINAGSSSSGGTLSLPAGITDLTLNAFTLQTTAVNVSGNIVVATGSNITHPQGNTAGLTITATNVDVQSGGKIDVSEKGYSGGISPTNAAQNANGQGTGGGIGTYCYSYCGLYGVAGAGYGGVGGKSIHGIGGGITYGVADNPSELGSGGGGYNYQTGYGGNGGGKLRINTSGILTVNGNIKANGGTGSPTYFGGSGSGGSIWITANTVEGGIGAYIETNGGGYLYSGNSGSGGGGRVEIEFIVKNFIGTVQANGGVSGFANGIGANGTVAENGTLVLNDFENKFAKDNSVIIVSEKENDNLIAEILSFVFGIQKAQAATADFTSETMDLNLGVDKAFITFTTLAFSADSGISFKIATNNDNSTWNFVGPNNDPNAFYTTSGQEITSEHDNNRYVKYKAYFTYATDEPHFNDVTLNYTASAYQTNQSLVSSWYNATDSANFLTGIVWDENTNLPSGTGVKFQVQTAINNDNATPGDLADDIPGISTGFMGPDGTTDTFFTNSDVNCTKNSQTVSCQVPNNITGDGADDQWIKYKITLDSSGAFTPQVDRVKLQYVVNFTPEVSNVLADQDATGKINLTYNLADGDNEIFSVFFAADIGVTLQNNPLTLSATTINLAGNYANLPLGVQTVQINREQIVCQSRTGATLNSCQRAQNNSRAFQHNQGDIVWFVATSDNTTGTGSGLSAGTGKTGTWTIKDDLPEVYKEGTTIRVVANDGTVANQVSEATNAVSPTFTLDTKNPGNLSINVDHRSDKEIVTIKNETGAVDDSTYKLYLSTTGTFDDSNEIPLPSPLAYPYEYDYSAVLSSITDQGTVWLKVKDAKGNVNDYNIQNQTMVVIPPKPKRILFYDISNVTADPPDYRELIAWTELSFSDFESYNVLKCSTTKDIGEAGNDCENEALPYDTLPNGQSVISDVSINFLPDKDLAPSIRNYYKVFTKDDYGNYSTYSDSVSDVPDGNGASSTTPPTISNVEIPTETITTTSATIKWNTNEISDSTVGYALDSESTPEYLPEYGNATLTNDHSLIITGLSPNKTYAVRVKSRDANGNLATVDKFNNGDPNNVFVFTTKEGPEILSFTFNQISNNEVSIAWNTDTDSDSSIYYSDDILESTGLLNLRGNGDLNSGIVHSDEKVKRHLQSITNLTKSKKYFFYLTSKDITNNIATDDNAGLFYEFTTDNDETDPVITIDESQPTIKSNNQAVIMWSTDEQATTVLKYKKKTQTADDYITLNTSPGIYNKSHYVIVSSLLPETNYDYKIISADINGNQAEKSKDSGDNDLKFKTDPDPDKDHPPLAEITFNDENPSVLTDTDAVISFATDQIASCMLNSWEFDVPEIINVPIQEEETSFNLNHNIKLSKLKFLTKYGYEVFCHDNIKDDNGEYTTIPSEKKDFTTMEKLYTASGAGALGDHVAPVINNVKVASTTGENAVITWDTDEVANSVVRYGIVSVDENIAGDSIVNKSATAYATAHTVSINGLIPGTKYFFLASSLDVSGNIAESSQSTFTTASPSSLSSIKVESRNLGEALITWETDKTTSSIVEYGLTTSYGERKESTTLTKIHSISLSGLNQGVVYHYRVKGKDANNNLLASADNTFEPKSPPKITDIAVGGVTEHGAVITFKTNVPTDDNVTYTDASNNSTTGSQGNRTLATEHSVKLINLSQGTRFIINVTARDEQATEATLQGPDFTTGKDQNPPKIDMVKTDLALTQNDKVQAIISWTTDEQSSSYIIYKEGRTGQEKEYKITDNLTNSHVGVITIFKPGTVYNFKVKSIDASGNLAVSNDFALLTPKKRENIIQIIIGNFSDIFGWAKF